MMKKTTGEVSAAARPRTVRAKAIVAAVTALLCTLHAGAAAPPAKAPDALIQPPEREALRFGESVAASGEIVIVGSPVDGDLGAGEGAAHVVRIGVGSPDPGGGAWQFAHLARLRSGATGDHFGCAVAVSREAATPTIAVGADRAWIRSGFEGAVFVFEGLEAGMSAARLAASVPQAGAEFGCCVTIDRTARFIAVGARREDVGGATDAGAVHLFTHLAIPSGEGGIASNLPFRWHCVQTLVAPHPAHSQWFGSALALGEEWLAVGAPGASASGLPGAGCVQLYRRNERGGFGYARSLASPNAASNAWFGSALAIEGTTLVVGEPRAAHDGIRCGAAWIYELTDEGSPPRQLLPAAHAHPSLAGLGFGMSVALDARFAVIGAPGIDETAQGEECGGGFVFARGDAGSSPDLALASSLPTPMLLCGSSAAVARVRDGETARELRVALLGHLFVEEESIAPSPGVALYALTPQDAPRTTSPACASSP